MTIFKLKKVKNIKENIFKKIKINFQFAKILQKQAKGQRY